MRSSSDDSLSYVAQDRDLNGSVSPREKEYLDDKAMERYEVIYVAPRFTTTNRTMRFLITLTLFFFNVNPGVHPHVKTNFYSHAN